MSSATPGFVLFPHAFASLASLWFLMICRSFCSWHHHSDQRKHHLCGLFVLWASRSVGAADTMFTLGADLPGVLKRCWCSALIDRRCLLKSNNKLLPAIVNSWRSDTCLCTWFATLIELIVNSVEDVSRVLSFENKMGCFGFSPTTTRKGFGQNW